MPWNKDGSRKGSALYKKSSGFKMNGWSAFTKPTDPPKGRIGSEYRKAEYDARGWAYDDTINTSDSSGGGDEVAKAKKRAPHRYAGLSDKRIKEILAKEAKRKARKSKYKRGSSDLK